jgi:excisionase family DNA binding protein
MTTIAIYTRLSKDDTGHQTATQRQEAACRGLAELRGWNVGEVFADVDLSAYQVKVQRPGYQALLAAVANGAIDGVLVWKLDRLVRRPAEFEKFWSACEGSGAFLASVTEPIDSSTEMGLALVRVLVTFAGLESATISLRLKAKYKEMALAGKMHGGPRPYGHTKDRMALVPEEAAEIRAAAALLIAGKSMTSIVRGMNRRGVATPGGGPWQRTSLKVLLTSPRLLGDATYHGKVVRQGVWAPILDRLTYARACDLLADIARRHPVARGYALTGLIHCGACGGRLNGHTRAGARTYDCRSEYDHGGVHVNAARLETWLAEVVAWRLARPAAPVSPPPLAGPDDERALTAAIATHASRTRELSGDYYLRHLIGRQEFLANRQGLDLALEADKRRLMPGYRETALDPDRRAHLAATFGAMSEEERTKAIREEVTSVTVHRGRAGRFDPTRLEVTWACRVPGYPELLPPLLRFGEPSRGTRRRPAPERTPAPPAPSGPHHPPSKRSPEWMAPRAAATRLSTSGEGLNRLLARGALTPVWMGGAMRLARHEVEALAVATVDGPPDEVTRAYLAACAPKAAGPSVRQLCRYIGEHPGQPMTLREMVEGAGVSLAIVERVRLGLPHLVRQRGRGNNPATFTYYPQVVAGTDSEWIGAPEAAKRLGIGLRAVYRLIDRGELPGYQVGRLIRLRASDVNGYHRIVQKPGSVTAAIETYLRERAGEWVSAADICRATGCGKGTPAKAIARLNADHPGTIQIRGATRTSRYRVRPNPPGK